MWWNMGQRKGSRVVAKLICLWLFLGAYHVWKRALGHGSRQEEGQATRPSPTHVHGRRYFETGALNEDVVPLPALEQDSRQLWIRSNHHAASRHLLIVVNCTPRAVEQFPWDFLTVEQRKEGWITVHCIIALYMFLALALVCDRYFVPSLEVLCELLNMETDIAGATFMAAGSSAPELATAVIGVFVTKDDVGLGTVVGSAIYNVMFVISMSSLFALSVVRLHWWPMMRDCMAYLLSVAALIIIIFDEVIHWYESVVLLLMYVLYAVFMKFNQRAEMWCVPRATSLFGGRSSPLQSETTVLYNKLSSNGTSSDNAVTHAHQEAESWHKLCERPEGCLWSTLWFVSLPLSTMMFVTVPDCRRPSLRKWFWITFILSLVWLSFFSFIMVWMITVIGYTADIPDSVMSLTFIAFGVSLPDVVASVLVVRDGLGDMAVSNAIGSNVFDILICLGIPWFLETCVKSPGSVVEVYSKGLLYSSLMLLSTVFFLLLATHINGWRLTKKYGLVLLVVYVIYTVLASLYELNVFGYFHPPECPSDY